MKIWVPVVKFKPIELGRTKPAPVYVDSPPDNHRPAKKRLSKLPIIAIIVVLILAGVIWLIFRGLNAPAEGVIDNSQAVGHPTKTSASGKYQDSYISFDYPAGYRVVPIHNSSTYLSSVSLLSNAHPTTHAAISLVKEQTSNDPAINYRQLHPELYKPVQTTDSSLVFSRQDNDNEYTGFIAHNGMVISISLTSVSPVHLKSDYDFMAKSLSWKQ